MNYCIYNKENTITLFIRCHFIKAGIKILISNDKSFGIFGGTLDIHVLNLTSLIKFI